MNYARKFIYQGAVRKFWFIIVYGKIIKKIFYRSYNLFDIFNVIIFWYFISFYIYEKGGYSEFGFAVATRCIKTGQEYLPSDPAS